jgi:hypothetical protein
MSDMFGTVGMTNDAALGGEGGTQENFTAPLEDPQISDVVEAGWTSYAGQQKSQRMTNDHPIGGSGTLPPRWKMLLPVVVVVMVVNRGRCVCCGLSLPRGGAVIS